MSNKQVFCRYTLYLLICLAFLVIATGCQLIGQGGKTGHAPETPPKQHAAPNPGGNETVKDPEPVLEERVMKASIAAVGDILIHSSVYKDAKTANGYDFIPMFEPIKAYIEQADLAIANSESVIGGEELGLSDYPRFNSPYEVGNALKATGFDAVTMANNHTIDRGAQAVMNAIAHWQKLGMEYVGANVSQEDQERVRIVERNGISFALLSYTYGTNGIPVPADKPFLVNLINLDTLPGDIRKAREMADVVIVNVHFGQEYVRMPNDDQKQFVQVAAEAGADIIIGHHPHVLQPMEWVDGKDGRKTFVVYSLGNFIAAQEGKFKRTGGIMQLDIVKRVKGDEVRIELLDPAFIPTWTTMSQWKGYKVVPLWEAPAKQLPDAEAYYEEVKAHMSQWIPELRFPREPK